MCKICHFYKILKNIFLVNYDSTKNMDNISVTIILKYLCMCIKASIKFSLWRAVHWFIPVAADRDTYDQQNMVLGSLCDPRLKQAWCSSPAWSQENSDFPLKFIVPDFARGTLGTHVPLVRCLFQFLHHVGIRWSHCAGSSEFPLTSGVPTLLHVHSYKMPACNNPCS